MKQFSLISYLLISHSELSLYSLTQFYYFWNNFQKETVKARRSRLYADPFSLVFITKTTTRQRSGAKARGHWPHIDGLEFLPFQSSVISCLNVKVFPSRDQKHLSSKIPVSKERNIFPPKFLFNTPFNRRLLGGHFKSEAPQFNSAAKNNGSEVHHVSVS